MAYIKKSPSDAEYLTVKSNFGSIRGFVSKDYPNITQFLGIHFAEAPAGSNRWLPPIPKNSVNHFDATEFGPSCPQWFDGPPSIYNSDVPEFRINDAMSEDCLSLSIWIPAKAAEDPTRSKLPVIVWITGGAFLVGGTTVPYQNPTPWVETSWRHIVVGINYRLTIFGFPNAAGLALHERNLGFLDQRLGLGWVHKHIASFGGDPARMTHFGQSEAITRNYFLKPAVEMARTHNSAYMGAVQPMHQRFATFSKIQLHQTQVNSLISPRPWQRAYHNSDLPLIFGTHSWFRGPSTALEEKISKAWQELYVVFAEEGPEGLRKLG